VYASSFLAVAEFKLGRGIRFGIATGIVVNFVGLLALWVKKFRG
jgi:hypothetical protein